LDVLTEKDSGLTEFFADFLPAWSVVPLGSLLIALIGGLAGLVVHLIVARFLRRLAAGSSSQTDDIVVARLISPTRWILMALGVSIAINGAPVDAETAAILLSIAGILVPLLLGWLALAVLRAVRDVVNAKSDIAASDNLAARRRRTRIGILARIGSFVIVFITICLMLLSIPAIRTVGVTLMASAGLIGLAVGAAAQPALKNIIAGVQMAFSEPIRIDDVVIIEGEWGRIEEIRLTYVVVKIWDERRLIVPIAKFLESAFQNWTRESSQLLGTAFLYVDPTADVPALRHHLETVVRDHAKWDGRVVGLQVTDVRPDVMELRALVSAADAGRAFDLRCDVREAMMAYIADEMPEALPRRRAELSGELAGRSLAQAG
jgi:small-conductance mechanosensitive channel